MKILITGGLGQIGSHIAELLIKRNDEVFVIDNLTTGEEHLKQFPNLKIYIRSIAERDFIYEIVNKIKPDVIVHAAGSDKDPDDWYNDTLTNCVGGSIIVDAARKNKVKKFIYFQTALCYGLNPRFGIPLDHPIKPEGSSYVLKKQLMNFI